MGVVGIETAVDAGGKKGKKKMEQNAVAADSPCSSFCTLKCCADRSND